MEKMNGAELLARSLASCGIDHVFIQEHQDTEPLLHALMAAPNMRAISPVSESCCAPMADGFSRFSGRPAAAVTAGDGHALNQLIGVASAWGDKSPLVSIALCDPPRRSSSPVWDRERPRLEESFTAVAKWTATLQEWSEIPLLVRRAFREALSGRMGPSHLEIPRGLLREERELPSGLASLLETRAKAGQVEAPPRPEPEKVKAALELLLSARRPLILAGGGVIKSGASDEINELAARLGIPITSTMGGMGAAYPDNPVFLGPASYLSGEAFHTAIKEAEVVLAVGCCFSGLDGLGLPPLWSGKIKFIQVNIDHRDIAINPPAELAVVADAKEFLREMLALSEKTKESPERKAWVEKLRRLNQEHLERIINEAERPWPKLHPAAVTRTLSNLADEYPDALVVLDGGNTALWTGMLVPVPGPRRGFFPVGMGTLGLGIPVSIGIKAAAPERPVVIVSGDGAFLYNIQELETMRRYKLPVVSVVLNDSGWNMIRAGQVMTGPAYGTDLPPQDYAAVARSYGLNGLRITDKAKLAPEFKKAMDSGEGWLIEVETDPDSLPDSLISFARVEFAGAKMPPARLLKGLRRGKINLDVRGWNLLKFIWKTM